MAVPAVQPATEVDRQHPARPRRGRRRPSRIAGVLLAVVAGLAAIGVGLVQTLGGLAGPPLGVAAGSASPSAASSGPAASPGGPAVGPAASQVTPAPSSSAVAGSSSGPSGPDGSPGPGQTPSERRSALVAARLQAALDRVRAQLAIPGVSATVILRDGSSWTGGSGLADVAAGTPVAADTAFAYASISKTFTSALILQLVDEGRLRLTDSAAGRLPPLRLAIDRRITIEMLLDHTSGLADFFLNPKIDRPLQAKPQAAWSIDRTLGYVGKRLSPPGAAWHYSNTNYLLLGLIAERLTGQTLAQAIRTRLLEPAGLGATWYQAGEAARMPLAHGYRFVGTKLTAKPIDLADGSRVAPFRSVVTAAAGAGSMAGTSGDLARWARALYGGTVLGPQGTALLLSGFTKTTNYLPGVVYGLGVQAASIDGHPSLGHSGRLLGFRSAVRHFPLDGLTIAVLTNQSRADPGLIVRALLAVAIPATGPCPACLLAG